jgi:hypothetical protein
MNRKPRKDSILHNLPPEQRVKVDKWLFDKGMSYAQVAESCARFLGVKVSKSSVARYYQRRMEGKIKITSKSKSKSMSGIVSGRGSEAMMEDGGKEAGSPKVSVSEMVSVSKSMSGRESGREAWEELYRRFIEGLMDAAWEAMERYEFELKHEGYMDLKEARWIVRLMRLIIAARRAEHVRTLALGERAAVRNSLRFKVQSSKLGKRRSPVVKVQRAESFVALCARWDRERERELTGGRRQEL